MGISKVGGFTPVYSLFSESDAGELDDKSFMENLDTFRKPGYSVRGLLRWAEVLSPANLTPFFTEQRKAVRLFTWTFDVPEFYEDVTRYSQELAELNPATTSLGTAAWVKKFSISSMDFAGSGLYLLQTLHITKLIDLAKYSTGLPSTIYTVSCVFQFGIKSFKMWEAAEGLKAEKVDKEIAIHVVRRFLKLFKATVRMLSSTLDIPFSVFWLLVPATLSYILGAVAEIGSTKQFTIES